MKARKDKEVRGGFFGRIKERAKEKTTQKKQQQSANDKAMQDAEKRKIYTIAGIFAVLGVAIVLYKTRKK